MRLQQTLVIMLFKFTAKLVFTWLINILNEISCFFVVEGQVTTSKITMCCEQVEEKDNYMLTMDDVVETRTGSWWLSQDRGQGVVHFSHVSLDHLHVDMHALNNLFKPQ